MCISFWCCKMLMNEWVQLDWVSTTLQGGLGGVSWVNALFSAKIKWDYKYSTMESQFTQFVMVTSDTVTHNWLIKKLFESHSVVQTSLALWRHLGYFNSLVFIQHLPVLFPFKAFKAFKVSMKQHLPHISIMNLISKFGCLIRVGD